MTIALDAPKHQLNAEQLRFCETKANAVRLLAPAGCGKTQSLLWRCRYLFEAAKGQHIKFLIFTFTKAARDELMDRIKSDPHLRVLSPVVSITTLNSWGFRQLKSSRHSLRLLTKNEEKFRAINNNLQPIWQDNPRIAALLQDKKRYVRASQELMSLIDAFKSLGLNHKQIERISDLQAFIDSLREAGMQQHLDRLVERLCDLDLVDTNKELSKELYRYFIKFWKQATDSLYQMSFITLEDQKYWAWLELEDKLQAKQYLSGAARYSHILVDEFQDINPLDLLLLKSIVGIHKADLTIVGDDDQSIYEWRGATPEFILSPDDHFDTTFETHILKTNYRSPANIVKLSQNLIRHNIRRVPKDIHPYTPKDAEIDIIYQSDLPSSVDYVLNLVKSIRGNDPTHNIALIGRKRSQIIPYQIVFAGQDIPFYAAEDLQVFLSSTFENLKEIVDVPDYADKKRDRHYDPSVVLLQLCNQIGRYPLSKAKREELFRFMTRKRPTTLREATSILRGYTGQLHGQNKDASKSGEYADAIIALIDTHTVSQSINALSSHFKGLQKDYARSIEDIFYADPPFAYLAEYARRYGADYVEFFNDLELAIETLARTTPDSNDEQSDSDEWKLPLHLMTALRAKGKEFDTVIILDANDGIWPGKLATTEAELEGERRLSYVAMTRAKKRLIFVVNEDIMGIPAMPSPYLSEMGLSIDI